MAQEIERKFLVHTHMLPNLEELKSKHLLQAYLAQTPLGVVRVRIAGAEAWLTIKSANKGISRSEFEYIIPVDEAAVMIEKMATEKIDKIRYYILFEGYEWELDQFLGDNQGLWLAEIELSDEKEKPPLPSWIAEEVSGDSRYYNSNLSLNPFKSWK